MEEKLLEEQRRDTTPRRDEPPPLKAEDEGRTRHAPPFVGSGNGHAAHGYDAPSNPPPPLFGPPVSRGWCRGESSRSLFREKEPLCAAISVDNSIQRPIAMEDVDFKAYWEENFVDDEGEEIGQETWNTLRRMMRENTRAHHEETLNNLPCVISAKVELNEDNGTLEEGVNMHYEVNFSEEFAEVRDIMLRDENYSDKHILWYVEGIAKFVEDLKEGTRDIDEISNLWSFERCLDVIYGERKEKEENPSKEAFKVSVENIVEQMEEVILRREGDEPDKELVPKQETISLIMCKKKRKKRNKKKSNNLA